MKNDVGIRVRGAELPFETFADPIEARMELSRIEKSLNQSIAGTYEIVYRTTENVITSFPDGKAYITDVKEKWLPLYKS